MVCLLSSSIPSSKHITTHFISLTRIPFVFFQAWEFSKDEAWVTLLARFKVPFWDWFLGIQSFRILPAHWNVPPWCDYSIPHFSRNCNIQNIWISQKLFVQDGEIWLNSHFALAIREKIWYNKKVACWIGSPIPLSEEKKRIRNPLGRVSFFRCRRLRGR